MGKENHFKPVLVPRYLPGSVANCIIQDDLKLYNLHRLNVFYAEPFVDTKPPKMPPHNYVKMRTLMDEAQRLQDIDRENKILLKKINFINRTKGIVETYNKAAYDSTSRWAAHEKRMLKIECANKAFYKELINVEPTYSTRVFEKDWQMNVRKMQHMAKYTMQMFLKKSDDQLLAEQPSISCGLERLTKRPLSFLQFRIKDGVRLGRVIIELYADYVPLTVRNFLAICKGQTGLTFKNSHVHKIVTGQYCEMGDITKGNGKGGMSIYGETFPEENYCLKHTTPGVLSMVRIGKKENNSQFSITFGAQEKLDGKRVVFGKVVKGINVIYQIEDMARRRVGPPTDIILIEKCGQLCRKK